jgi:hypothetical protein
MAMKAEFLGQLWNAKVTIRFSDLNLAVQFALEHGGWIARDLDNVNDPVTWFSSKWPIVEAFESLPSGNFLLGPYSMHCDVQRIIPSIVWH